MRAGIPGINAPAAPSRSGTIGLTAVAASSKTKREFARRSGVRQELRRRLTPRTGSALRQQMDAASHPSIVDSMLLRAARLARGEIVRQVPLREIEI